MRVPVFCGKDCGGGACPMLAEIEEGRVERILPNPVAGKWILPCSRGLALADEHYSPLRLRAPLVRRRARGCGARNTTGSAQGRSGAAGSGRLEDFRETSWDEALDLVAMRLGETASRFGKDSVMALVSAGSVGALHSTSDLAERFLSLWGGFTHLEGSYSNGAARVVLPYLLGPHWRSSGFDPATMRHSEMIVLWGANVLEARLGSEIPARLLEAKARGATIVVIDPRRSHTVERTATWHIACRPGTDTALMLALLEVLLEEGLAKREWAVERSVGFEALEGYVLGDADGLRRGPEWAEPITGVPAGDIRRLARSWATASPVMLLPGYSIQRVRGGEEPYRLSVALQLATGNFGLLGGSTGSLNNRLPTPRVGSIDSLDSPERPAVPVLLWPDAILGGKEAGFPTDIHAALVAGGNWLGQGADARKSARALDSLDFSFCLEMFPTPTALRCDLILPVASPLEKEDIGIPWLGNWLSYKPKLFSPAGLARSDYDIYADLAARMGFGEAFTEGRDEAGWVNKFLADSEIPDTERFRREGFFLAPEQERAGLADFALDPSAHPLGTPSGKVEIESVAWARDSGGSAIPTWSGSDGGSQGASIAEPGPGELLLVTPKVGHRTHSQGGDPATLARSGGHFLSIHPLDAAERGLAEGQEALIEGESGIARAQVRLDGGLMRGVASLPEGVWLPTNTDNYDDSSSPNLLSSTLDHGPAKAVSMHGLRVRVAKAPKRQIP
ncbi:MAG TPA: molybdopterin-dependent oxidoreductase [Rectinemataceae bacterium]|nr:molybdopterin-dependent oxidoreductase [Rectinemataceae bacterium]